MEPGKESVTRFGEVGYSPIDIPVSVFATKASPLESAVCYLKEKHNLRIADISRLLGRNPRNIGPLFRKTESSNYEKSKVKIPLSILSRDKLSILENIVYFLNKKGISKYRIAKMLNKNTSTIYTAMERAEEKLYDEKDLIKFLKDKHKLSESQIRKFMEAGR